MSRPNDLINRVTRAWRNLAFTCALGIASVSCMDHVNRMPPPVTSPSTQNPSTFVVKKLDFSQFEFILQEGHLQSAKGHLSEEFIQEYAEELELIAVATGEKSTEAYKHLPQDLMRTNPLELVLISQEYKEITPAIFSNFGNDTLDVVNKHATELDQIIEFSGGNAYEVCQKMPSEFFKKHPKLMVRTAKIARGFTPDVYEIMLAYYKNEKQWKQKLDVWEFNKEKHGITHFHRYLGTPLLKENVKNKDKKYKPHHPVALIIHNQNDWNGAFAGGWYWHELEELVPAYKIFTYEVAEEKDMLKFIKETYLRSGNKEINVWLVGGHGTQISLNLGLSGKKDSIWTREGMKDYDKYYLDITDEKQLKEYTKYFSPHVLVPLISCSTGEGKAGADNLANTLGNVFPQGIIFAPTISTHLKRLNLNKN
ncbi:hypothetical protein GOV03_01330, partial [Candidatus Woesearchaeota archaeon]|nr:hypothetical protein [Candidatus Woesearchaeota archaeon]